jgi:hypothetical protein
MQLSESTRERHRPQCRRESGQLTVQLTAGTETSGRQTPLR